MQSPKRTKNGALSRQPISVCLLTLRKGDEALKPNLLYFYMRKQNMIHTEVGLKNVAECIARTMSYPEVLSRSQGCNR